MDILGYTGYATICRLCLQKDGFMFGIFNHSHTDKSIYKKIMDCTALQISAGDGLPKVICHRCLYKIEFCLEFRQLCFVSDATLRQFFNVNNKEGSVIENSQLEHTLQNELQYDHSDAVIVVDPNSLDYNSDESERSENDNTEMSESAVVSNISMCKYCDHAFMNKADCVAHESMAHDCQSPYSCLDCNMKFEDRLQYATHLKSIHQNDKPFKCPQCDRTFARRSDLRKHTIVHTGIKPFTCKICFKSFSRNTNLSKHARIHTLQKLKGPKKIGLDLKNHKSLYVKSKTFHCNYCKATFVRKDKLLKHEKTHTQEDILEEKVDIVDEFFYEPNLNETNDLEAKKSSTWNNSENMVISVDPFSHNGFTNIESNGTTDYFNTPTDNIKVEAINVEADNNLEHGFEPILGDKIDVIPKEVERPFSCDTCNKRFSTNENLRYHQASHSGIRPYSCSTCSKTFVRKRELDRHIVTHTGMKPFKCTRCNKSFGRKDKLIRHLRIHDVLRPHVCNECDVSFSRRDGLAQHKKTHIKKE